MATVKMTSKRLVEKKQIRNCENPLIIVVAVSEYDGLPNLAGPPQDYHSIAFGMNYKRGYTMIYFDKNNKLHQIGCSSANSTSVMLSAYDASTLKQDPNFKIKWTMDEIDEFNDKILEKLENRDKEILSSNNNDSTNSESKKQVKYDGLIYFISGHGDRFGKFYDSNDKKLELETKFFNRFNNKNCNYFYGKPKVFIVDCCRGVSTSQKHKTDEYKQIEADKNNTKNDTIKNEIMDVSLGLDSLNSPCGDDGEVEIMEDEHHIQDDIRLVFSTIDSYKAADSTLGGYLIRGVITILCRSKNMNDVVSFSDLIKMANALVNKKLIGDHIGQSIDDVNHWNFDLKLKAKIKVLF